MFTAQIKRGNPGLSMGVAEADNEAFVLNILDWLGRRIGEAEPLADE